MSDKRPADIDPVERAERIARFGKWRSYDRMCDLRRLRLQALDDAWLFSEYRQLRKAITQPVRLP